MDGRAHANGRLLAAAAIVLMGLLGGVVALGISLRNSQLSAASSPQQSRASSSAVATSSCTVQMRWMISIETLRLTQQIDTSLAERHFNNAETYVIEEYPQHDSPYGTVVARFRSFATFQKALSTNKINRATKWVLYDNEGWNFTPRNEQVNPRLYESMFVSLAHQHGYQVILAPAQDLVPAFQHQARAWPDYLAMGLAKVSATGDIYETQAQPYETDIYRGTTDYVDFVHQASSQARATNPKVVVMAGLSTHRVQDAQQMVDDYRSVKGVVDGYWLNVPNLPPGPRPDLLVGFLRLLDATPGGTCARV